jgi:lexA repressor
MSLVSRIKRVALSKGMGLTDIENKLNFGKKSMYRWDLNSPSASKVLEVANLLQVPIYWLLTGETEVYNTENTEDADLINKYHKLSKIDKTKIDNFIEISLIDINTKTDKNKTSIEDKNHVEYDNYTDEDNIKDEVHEYMKHKTDIPVLGYVAAGKPILAINIPLGYTNSIPKATYALYAKGQSMEPVIKDSELIYVRQQPQLDNGDIGIFYIDEEVTCKKLKKIGNTIELHSFNDKFKPLIYDLKDIETLLIQGKVILTPEQSKRYNNLRNFI